MNLAASSPHHHYLRSVVRIVASFTFFLHGIQKFNYLGGLGGHSATPYTMLWAAGIIECIGAPLLFVGLFTRPVAFILSGEMAIGYFRTHFPRSFWPLLNGGEVTVVYCFLFLYLAFAGPGPWSLDALIWKKK